MKRRDLLKSLPALFALPLVGALPTSTQGGQECAVPRNLIVSFAPQTWRKSVASQIIEESGDMWLAARERWNGRNPILIAFDDDIAVEVTRGQNSWKIRERVLTWPEIVERDKCRDHYVYAFSEYPHRDITKRPCVGDRIVSSPYTVRAWIKNGRNTDWNMSVNGLSSQARLRPAASD